MDWYAASEAAADRHRNDPEFMAMLREKSTASEPLSLAVALGKIEALYVWAEERTRPTACSAQSNGGCSDSMTRHGSGPVLRSRSQLVTHGKFGPRPRSESSRAWPYRGFGSEGGRDCAEIGSDL
jgi:hypothetical protein